jgi:antitoxin HicB
VAFDGIAARGKGGHWTVQYGQVRLPVPQAKGGDIAAGTLHSILRGFGLRREDLERRAMRFAYPIELSRMTEEDGGIWLVTFPDWNNAVTDGDDIPEALANARDCLEEMIAYHIRKREPISAPSPAGNRRMVEPEAGLALKAALWLGMQEQGVTAAGLASRLENVSEEQVERLLNPRLKARPELIHRALAALGKRIVVELEDAA